MKGWLVLLACAQAFGIGYTDVAPIIRARCAICHKGPVLDLQAYPLQSQNYPAGNDLATEILRRLRLTEWRKMPPVNATPLTASELQKFEAWLRAGMPRLR